MNDPSTRESAEACYPGRIHPPEQGLCVAEADAVNIRNHHIVESSMRFAGHHKARLMVLFCGGAHLAGSESYKFPEEESLAAHFTAKNAALCALPLEPGMQKDVARARLIAKEDSFFLELPPTFSARYKRSQYAPPEQSPSSERLLACEQDERTYFDRMAVVAGLQAPGLAGAPYAKQQTRHHDRINHDFSEWAQITADTVAARARFSGPSVS